MRFFNFLLMNVLFLTGMSFKQDDALVLPAYDMTQEVVSYSDIAKANELNDLETIKIVSNNFDSFEELLTYFISLVGSFLGTLLINIIKSKFPKLFLKKSEVVENSNKL